MGNMKTETISQSLERLSPVEREQLDIQAKQANMTTSEYVEFVNKSQIYRNAEEVMKLNKAKLN